MSDGARWCGVQDFNELAGLVFSGLSALVMEGVADEGGDIRVSARTQGGPMPCPACGTLTAKVHGVHGRTIADVPVDGRRVIVSVRLRRLVCPLLGCPRQTFREQVPGLVERYQRRTNRLADQLSTVVKELAVSRDGTSFCGSTTFLFDMLRFCVDQAGIPLLDAVRMCTTTPARVARIDATGLGTIVAGGPANLVLADSALRLCSVFSEGRWIERSKPCGRACCDA